MNDKTQNIHIPVHDDDDAAYVLIYPIWSVFEATVFSSINVKVPLRCVYNDSAI